MYIIMECIYQNMKQKRTLTLLRQSAKWDKCYLLVLVVFFYLSLKTKWDVRSWVDACKKKFYYKIKKEERKETSCMEGGKVLGKRGV